MRNLKITGKMSSLLTCINHNIMLDTLLISEKAKMENLSEQGTFKVEEALEIREVVKYFGDIPLCSKMFFEGIESTGKFYKRFDENSEIFKCNKKIEITKGKFKNYANQLRVFNIKEVVFYCVGDKEKIKEILERVQGIGKKITQGYGFVKEWVVEDYKEDLEWFDIDKPLRPIPVELFENENKRNIREVAYKFPYWAKENRKLCYV